MAKKKPTPRGANEEGRQMPLADIFRQLIALGPKLTQALPMILQLLALFGVDIPGVGEAGFSATPESDKLLRECKKHGCEDECKQLLACCATLELEPEEEDDEEDDGGEG